jgi:hypothetical protein
VIVGVVILHVVAQLYLVQFFAISTVPLSNLFPFGLNVALADLLLCAYHVLPLLLALNVILPLLLHTHALCVFASLLNHITLNPLGAVIVGHVAHVDTACAVQLYVAGIVLLILVALIVFPFSTKFTLNVTASFFVIAYHVLLLLLLVNVNFFVLVL